MKLLVYRVDGRNKSKDRHKSKKRSGLLGGYFSEAYGSSSKRDSGFGLKNARNEPGRRGYYGQKQKLSFERFMFLTFIIAFTLLIVVQAALVNPAARTFISGGNELEGTPLGVEEHLYEEGEISLKLLNGSPNEKLKVLVNGDEAAVFNSNIIGLKVMDGDVVEIDGSELNEEAEVVILSKSDNINADCTNKRVKIKSGVKKLTQIKID